MAPNNLIGALEMLAAKRREFTSAIVTLASALGVDAAPYLDVPTFVSVDLTQPGGAIAPVKPVSERLRDAAQRMREPEKKEPPRNPHKPASPSTNGTGRANKVAARQQAILEAMRAGKGKPIAPSELAHELGWEPEKLRRHITPLIEAGTVIAEGVTNQRRFSLPS